MFSLMDEMLCVIRMISVSDDICNFMTKVGNAFKIIKHHIPEANKAQLYYAYIHSKVRYGIEVFG